MRRILQKILTGETENFGDTSTLINPSVIKELIKEEAGQIQLEGVNN